MKYRLTIDFEGDALVPAIVKDVLGIPPKSLNERPMTHRELILKTGPRCMVIDKVETVTLKIEGTMEV